MKTPAMAQTHFLKQFWNSLVDDPLTDEEQDNENKSLDASSDTQSLAMISCYGSTNDLVASTTNLKKTASSKKQATSATSSPDSLKDTTMTRTASNGTLVESSVVNDTNKRHIEKHKEITRSAKNTISAELLPYDKNGWRLVRFCFLFDIQFFQLFE